jgi:hypothetical protein
MYRNHPALNKILPVILDLTRLSLEQVSSHCKYSSVGYVIGPHMNAV